ncbi:MAG: polyphosphate kinase 1 [Bacteroidetes bacterium]|nr:polyphosphate kinase 1 [Bacteroidota bacterium]
MGVKTATLINRDISWLSFNDRVLQEAADTAVPLIERIKFLGIFSNNRDEFFRVRVATIKRMTKAGKKAKEQLGQDPKDLLEKIQKIVIIQQNKSDKIYTQILKDLERNNIYIINEKQLNTEHQNFVKAHFLDNVLPSLFPIMLDSAPDFPYLKDNTIYLLVRLTKFGKDKKSKHSLIEIPTTGANRFLVLPSAKNKKYIILIDDVIRFCLDDIYSIFDYDSIEAHTIKLTRDAELDIDQDVSKSFVEKISKSVKKRKRGQPVRLTYDCEISKDMLTYLTKRLKPLNEENLIPGGRYHNFKDFMNFPDLGRKDLKYTIPHPLSHPFLDIHKSVFKTVREKDILLTFPYQSYQHIIDFLREASIDPKVESIKITLYRAAKNSNIINALINALKNGKQVTIVVELQARFDEENNIYWANKLQEEGATVIFGVPHLKVHSKLFSIVRKENNKKVVYAHVGTGNFNEDSAKIYSDFSLLTADKRITDEVEKLFEFYSDNLKVGTYKHLLVAPFTMRKKFMRMIQTEIDHAREGKEAYISIKLNSLVDAEIISKLYEANAAGVKMKIIVRGVCSLVTQIAGMSDKIECISIVDKYLEHARVFIFCNGGDEKIYISSADWMNRNLDYRSEVAIPIYDKHIQTIIKSLMDIQWKDNTKARTIDQKQTNVYKSSTQKTKIRAQDDIYLFFKNNFAINLAKSLLVETSRN